MGIIPARFRESRLYDIFQRLLRILQFLSAVISLGCFSTRLRQIIKLAGRASTANGAVEGILAAAVAYTLIVTLTKLLAKSGRPRLLPWILMILDILFVIAFIVVAVLTRPNAGTSSGPCTRSERFNRQIQNRTSRVNCNLPWGTFITAIFSTLLHALSTIFHEVRDHHKQRAMQDQYGNGNTVYKEENGTVTR